MGTIQDVQLQPLVIANDSTEQIIYAVVVPGGSITSTARYQMVINGLVSTRALLPGTLTLRLRLNGNVSVVVAETPLTGASNVKFAAELDAWLRSDGTIGLGGLFAQNAGDLMSPPGVRLGSTSASADLSIDQLLTASVQFSTADPANTFTRTIATLIVQTG